MLDEEQNDCTGVDEGIVGVDIDSTADSEDDEIGRERRVSRLINILHAVCAYRQCIAQGQNPSIPLLARHLLCTPVSSCIAQEHLDTPPKIISLKLNYLATALGNALGFTKCTLALATCVVKQN